MLRQARTQYEEEYKATKARMKEHLAKINRVLEAEEARTDEEYDHISDEASAILWPHG